MPGHNDMKGASANPLAAMPAEARGNLMKSSDSIRAVLMSRLANMGPEELRMLDSAITPEVARVLMKLLPELQELIGEIEGMNARQPQRPQMGALGNMG